MNIFNKLIEMKIKEYNFKLIEGMTYTDRLQESRTRDMKQSEFSEWCSLLKSHSQLL